MARRADPKLAALLENFVCVRLVRGWGLDLSLFQFDGDMTLAAFFLNADRTVYGRYGTKHARDSSLEGLVQAATAALELHRRHPADKAALARKTGPAPPWETPEAMPTLSRRHAKEDVSDYGCIHCHTIREGELTSRWRAGEKLPDRLLWQYPLPNVLGLGLEAKDGRSVRSVSNASAAHAAGFRPGDAVVRVEGQPVTSLADVSWALHQAPESGTVTFEVERTGQAHRLTVALAEGWRRRIGFARNNTTAMLQMSVAGFFAHVLSGGEKKKWGLEEGALGLRVSYLPGQEREANLNAVKAGVRVGDVIVEVDGRKGRLSADEWLAYLLQGKKPGETLELAILRGGARVSIPVPLPK